MKPNEKKSKASTNSLFYSIKKDTVLGFTFAAFISIVLTFLQLSMPVYMSQVYDRVMSSRSLETLVALTIIVIFCFIIQGFLDAIRGQTFSALGHTFSKKMTPQALEAAMYGAVKGNTQGPGQVYRDVGEIRGFFSGGAISVPFDAATSPLFFIVLYLIHPVYGTVALVGGIILIALSTIGQLISAPSIGKANDEMISQSAHMGKAARGAEAIEAMGMMPNLLQKWQSSHHHYLYFFNRGTANVRAVGAVVKVARLSVQVAILAAGAVLVIEGETSAGSLFAASILMSRALAPFEKLVEGCRSWASAREAYRRLSTILLESKQASKGQVPNPSGHLIVEKLSYVPPGSDRPILRNVSFTVSPGEVLGIVGQSAAGKSTLVRLILGVLQPTAGGAYLDGQNVWTWDRAHFGQYVGYLPQNVGLLEGTIMDNICRMSEEDYDGAIQAARLADVHEIIGRLPEGYATKIGENGGFLSGGQRQRIALARAVYGSPKLLVLDEPNSSLDQAGDAALSAAVDKIKAAGGSVIIVSHRPSALNSADKILVLRDGVVDQIGSRTEVFKRISSQPGQSQNTPEKQESNLATSIPANVPRLVT